MAGEPARRLALLAFVGAFLSATPSGSAPGDSRSPSRPAEALSPYGTAAELVVGDAAVDLIDALFVKYDPDYLDKITARRRRFDALAERLFARAEAGHDTQCSRQIFLEAKWLLSYTAWWSRIDCPSR